MEGFLNKDGKDIVEELIRTIQKNKAYLSDIDGLIGDGDHGINMNKGFTLCEERIRDADISLADALKTLGRVLMMEIGGSMGPLYGTMFAEMARSIKKRDLIDKQAFGEMLKWALEGLREIGGATVGDKTLMDVLIPAEAAYQAAIASGQDFKACLDAMQKPPRRAGCPQRIWWPKLAAQVGWAKGPGAYWMPEPPAATCCLMRWQTA